MYHTALAKKQAELAAPVDRWEGKGSVAFVHDISDGLTQEFDDCDILYADLPWLHGFREFNDRAGKPTGSYPEFVGMIEKFVVSSGKPAVLVAGRFAIRAMTPHAKKNLTLNGADALAATYNISLDKFPNYGDTKDLLRFLAANFRRVGDFMCGYGRSARIFVESGGTFVASDFNSECIGRIAIEAPTWKPA